MATLYSTLGRHERARDLLIHVLEGLRKQLAEDHRNVLTTRLWLGSCYEDLHDLTNARILTDVSSSGQRNNVGERLRWCHPSGLSRCFREPCSN